jgi:hypothetical protein
VMPDNRIVCKYEPLFMERMWHIKVIYYSWLKY